MVYLNAISYHMPSTALSNEQLIAEYLPYKKKEGKAITAEELFNQNWIKTRHQVALTDTAKDLGNRAAENLFEQWNIRKEEIQYLVFVSDALDYKGPTTACVMQNDLGLSKSIGAIDVLHGCTGFVYGLSLISALIESGQIDNALLITADIPTKVIHPADIELRAIFSDAGAATFLSKEKIKNGINAEVGKFVFGTDGSGENALKVERSGSRNPADVKWLKQFEEVPHGNTGGKLYMKSSAIFLFALRTVPKLVKQILQKEGWNKEDIDFYVFHQANGQMLDFIGKRMKLPKEKVIINIENIGNTVSASIPIALYQEYKKNTFSAQQKALLAGFGIGLSWGATTLKFT